ncbi:MAG: VOC family protein [Geminicoccaceae bacterium]|nr:VOC family protein [Geminicoccaceae bacterium]
MQLIDHVSLVVDDMSRAAPFYDAIMDVLGAAKVGQRADWLGYGERCRPGDDGHSYISVRLGSTGGVRHGVHCCFKAGSPDIVRRFWEAGIAHGGACGGPPGLRSYHSGYYAAFLIDPSRNRLEAVFHGDGKI